MDSLAPIRHRLPGLEKVRQSGIGDGELMNYLIIRIQSKIGFTPNRFTIVHMYCTFVYLEITSSSSCGCAHEDGVQLMVHVVLSLNMKIGPTDGPGTQPKHEDWSN